MSIEPICRWRTGSQSVWYYPFQPEFSEVLITDTVKLESEEVDIVR